VVGMLVVGSALHLGCGSSLSPGVDGADQLVPDASADAVPGASADAAPVSSDVAAAASGDVAPGALPSDDEWPRYQPTSVGSTWTIAITRPGEASPSIEVETVTDSSPAAFTVKVDLSDGGWRLITNQVSSQGLMESSIKTYAADGTLTTNATFSPPEIILPPRLAVGSSASSTSTQTTESFTRSLMASISRDLTVTGPEQITVPAGTFTAMKVTTIVTTDNGLGRPPTRSYNVRWWAFGIGAVKTVNYPESAPSSATTFELTEYKVQ
jgi:hypothetical protein